MRFHLKIEDCSAEEARGESVSVIAEGRFSGGELTLEYLYDGARYTMKVGENYVLHNRFGETEMRLEFRQGVCSQGAVKCGNMGGSLGIYTHELKILLSPNGCNARIRFSGGESDGDISVKNITAYAVK